MKDKVFRIQYTNYVYCTVTAKNEQEAREKFDNDPDGCEIECIEAYQDASIKEK